MTHQFKHVILAQLGVVVVKWQVFEMGVTLDGKLVNHIWWADDLFLFAKSIGEMQTMIDDISQAIAQAGYGWKRSHYVA